MGGDLTWGKYFKRGVHNTKQFQLSAMEQRAFARLFKVGAPNLTRRFLKKCWIIPLVYLPFYWGDYIIWDMDDRKRKYRLEEYAHLFQGESQK